MPHLVTFATALVVTLTLLAPATAIAQKVKDSAISGKILSGFATSASGVPGAILTVPPAEEGKFILTQACGGNGSQSVTFFGNTIGQFASFGDAAGGQVTGRCTSYDPGLALPAGEEITCVYAFGTAQPCSATGVLSKK